MNDHRHSRERFHGKAKAKASRLCVWLRPSVCPDPSFFEPVRMLRQFEIDTGRNKLLQYIVTLLNKNNYFGSKWELFGLRLGVEQGRLKAIKEGYGPDCEACLKECLKHWLNQDGIATEGQSLTWKHYNTLCKALKYIEEVAIAVKLENKMASLLLQKHQDALHKSLSSMHSMQPDDLNNVMKLLLPEKLMTEEDKIAFTEDSKVESIVSAIQKKAADLESLEKLSKVLSKYPQTEVVAAAIQNDYESGEELEIMKESKMLGTESSRLYAGYASIKHTLKIPKSMSPELVKRRQEFASMFCKVVEKIKNISPPVAVDDLKIIIQSYCKGLKDQLNKPECINVSAVMRTVLDKCTVINIKILEHIVEELNISEAKKLIQEYETSTKKFVKDNFLLLQEKTLDQIKTPALLECETIVVVIDWKADTDIKEDVEEYLSSVFGNYSIEIDVKSMREGNSVTITASFPLCLFERLLVSAFHKLPELKARGLLRLKIGYCTLFEVASQLHYTNEIPLFKRADVIWNILVAEIFMQQEKKLVMIQQKEDEFQKKISEKDLLIAKQIKKLTEIKSMHTEKEQLESECRALKTFKEEHSKEICLLHEQLLEKNDMIQSLKEKEPKLMTTKLHEDTNKGVHIKELTEKERMHTEEKEKLESECRALKTLEEEHSKEICTLQEKISTLSVQLLQKNDIIKSLKEKEPKLMTTKLHEDTNKDEMPLIDFGDEHLISSEPSHFKQDERRTEQVRWEKDGLWVTSPSLSKCTEVLIELAKNQKSRVELQFFSPECISKFLSGLSQTKKMRVLKIYNTPLSEDSLSHLSPLMPQLELIELDNTSMTSAGVQMLVDLLKGNTSLKILKISHDKTVDETAGYHLADLLDFNTTLQEIGLSDCNVADNGVKALTESLKHNNTLKALSLSWNPISTPSAEYLADLLKMNKTIKNLYLRGTPLTNHDLLPILQAISQNERELIIRLDPKYQNACKSFNEYEKIKDMVDFSYY